MIAVTKRRHGFSECFIPIRPKDACAGEIICYRRIGVSSCEPEVIGNSSLSDAMAAKQVHVIILLLSDLPLLARGRDGRRQLTSTALHVQRVIVGVMLVTHSEQNVRITECL